MVWKRRFYLAAITSLLLLDKKIVSTQYINGYNGGNCACQNAPVSPNLPVNLILPAQNNCPLPTNMPVASYANLQATPPPPNLQLANLPVNSIAGLSLSNACNCNQNRNINSPVVPNFLPPAQRMASALNMPTESLNIVVKNANMPIGNLNVPIVNEVPLGALQVARNLPIAGVNNQIPNGIQIYSKSPVNYQNTAISQPNYLQQLPINMRNLPVNNLANFRITGMDNQLINSLAGLSCNNQLNRYPVDNFGRPLNNLVDFRGNNLVNLPNSNVVNVPFNSYANQPVNNVPYMPFNNVANIPANNFANIQANRPNTQYSNLANLPIEQLLNLQVSNMAGLSTNNFANSPVNNIVNFPVNNLGNLPVNNLVNLPVNNLVNLPVNNLVNLPTNNIAASQNMINAGLNERVVTKVPVVSLNSLASLPAYNGLPVIKASETVYRITPV